MKGLSFFLLLVVLLGSCKSKEYENDVEIAKPQLDYTIKRLDSADLSAGRLERISIASSFVKSRPVDVWLPNNYSQSKSYAVLYMHDGQMLFDSTTTWNKQEWKVDEWATGLMESGRVKDFIVVGIHNIPEIRWFDLFPEKAFKFLNPEAQDSLLHTMKNQDQPITLNGNNYLSFLVEELKPVIDYEYSVNGDRQNTYVAGSSMGGLMSMYAMSEYPDVFKGAACLSTHWVGALPYEDNPLPDAIFNYMEENFPDAGDHLVYFDYGNQTLDQYYPQYAPKVDAILLEKGYSEVDSQNLFFEGTNHSENAWNERLNYPLEFLLGKQ
jgi:predicted alpha/beta superfamily hydrolase